MKITMTFKNFEHTPAIDKHIREKSEKLAKYFDGNTHISWACYSKDGGLVADVKFAGPTMEYHASANSEDLYKTIDLVLHKLEGQIQKQKDKWASAHKGKTEPAFESEKDDDDDDDDF